MASNPDENHPAKNPTLESNQCEEQPDQDFISRLPDEILHLILSKLEIRDAAVTTAVSNRWAQIFPTMPSLEIINASFIPRYPDYDLELYGDKVLDCLKWLDALFSVFDSRIGPIKNFDIAVEILDRCDDHFYNVFGYVCAAGVEELSIRDTYIKSLYKIPSPVFACKTITKLEIDFCNLVVPSKLTGLQSVKLLVLSEVKVADDHLRRMISRCTALEKLEITGCYKVKNIIIHAPNLLVLKVSHCRPVGIVLKSAPRLDFVSVSFCYDYGWWKFYYGPFEDKDTDDEEDFVDFNPYNPNKTFEGTNVVENLVSFLNRLWHKGSSIDFLQCVPHGIF